MTAKILLVDDETTLVEGLRYRFQREGYEVCTAADGETALTVARHERPDLIVLDIMLPKLDGFEVCRRLRQQTTAPIIMLTAKEDQVDKVVGLEIGADDYMTKPFDSRELLARVKAMLRRVEMTQQRADGAPGPAAQQVVRVGPLEIDLDRHRAFAHGKELTLKPKVFDLLAFLARHRGRALSREQILEQVWGYDYGGDTRTVDVHVRWLREKIEEDPGTPQLVETVRGVGYRFRG